MLDMILSQAVNGLVLGFLYVLIAIGLSIIFGMLGIVNFAHGAFFAVGAYLAYVLAKEFGWWAALAAPLLTGAIGIIVEMILIRHLYGKEPLLGLILTFAPALLAEAVLRLIFGGAPVPFTAPKFLAGFVEYGPILITKYRMFVLLTTALALIALSTCRSSSAACSAWAVCSPASAGSWRRRSGPSRRRWRPAPSCRLS